MPETIRNEYCDSPKSCMAVAYRRETGDELVQAGLDAAYAEIISSFHGEMEEFVRKYCPKRLVELDALMDQAFWQYH
jgi:hypothetical protein